MDKSASEFASFDEKSGRHDWNQQRVGSDAMNYHSSVERDDEITRPETKN